MSSEAWADYRVPGAPYFVLVDGDDPRARAWRRAGSAVASLVRDAIEDERDGAGAGRVRGRRARRGGHSRAQRIDDTLAAAGIGPDHPSLYPGGAPEER